MAGERVHRERGIADPDQPVLKRSGRAAGLGVAGEDVPDAATGAEPAAGLGDLAAAARRTPAARAARAAGLRSRGRSARRRGRRRSRRTRPSPGKARDRGPRLGRHAFEHPAERRGRRAAPALPGRPPAARLDQTAAPEALAAAGLRRQPSAERASLAIGPAAISTPAAAASSSSAASKRARATTHSRLAALATPFQLASRRTAGPTAASARRQPLASSACEHALREALDRRPPRRRDQTHGMAEPDQPERRDAARRAAARDQYVALFGHPGADPAITS